MPSSQVYYKLISVQQQKINPTPFSTYIPEALLGTAFYFTLFGTFFINVNPYGSTSLYKKRGKQNEI
jgi:hypothetical protein